VNLYIVRHADALPINMQDITSDADRPLSDEGHRQVKRLAAGFKRLDIRPDRVLTSPLRRAREAAQDLVQHLNLTGLEAVHCDHLAPGGSSRKLAKALRQLDVQNVILVGHEPDLGRHTAHFIGSKRARIEFAKGGCACVACDNPPRKGTGALMWLLTPMWLDS
jgi:phosphohistidine phosphatase